MTFLLNRLTEASTWAGIASFLALVAGSTTGWTSYAAGAGAAGAAALAAFMKDHGAPDKPAA